MKIHLISNPKSGTFCPRKINQAIEFFENSRIEYRCHYSQYPGHAEKLLKDLPLNKDDIIVVCGGDGTLNEVINAIAGTPVRVGILPMGTANVVALQFGIPRDILSACKVILAGKTIPFCISRSNDRYFVFSVSVGPDSLSVHEVNLRLKNVIGKGAYVFSFLKALIKRRLLPVCLRRNDGPKETCYGVIVGTITLYAGRFKLFPKAMPQSGQLHCCIFKEPSRGLFLLSLFMIASGFGHKCPWIELTETNKLSLSSLEDYPVQVDGCPRGTLPVALDGEGSSISLIVP